MFGLSTAPGVEFPPGVDNLKESRSHEVGGVAGRPMSLPELSHEEIRRYSRHLLLDDVGMEGQRRLKSSSVLCIGSGGLGSPLLMYLAAAGVGTIGIVDDDVVDESNLQRQIVHATEAVGTPKVDSARLRIAQINPLVGVVTHRLRLDATNALELVRPYDLVVDGSDNFPTRYLVNDVRARLEKYDKKDRAAGTPTYLPSEVASLINTYTGGEEDVLIFPAPRLSDLSWRILTMPTVADLAS